MPQNKDRSSQHYYKNYKNKRNVTYNVHSTILVEHGIKAINHDNSNNNNNDNNNNNLSIIRRKLTSEYDQMHLWSDCIEHFLIFLKEI